MDGRRLRSLAPSYIVVEIEFLDDNSLVRIHYGIKMIWRIGLAPWEFEFLFPCSLTSTFLGRGEISSWVQGFRVPGSGIRVWGLGYRVWGIGNMAYGIGYRVYGKGFRV